MFIQSTLTKPQAGTNRRVKTGKRPGFARKSLQKVRQAATTAGSANSKSGTISVPGRGKKKLNGFTDSQIPRYGTRIRSGEKSAMALPSITPWKVILTSFLIGICGILYITHVFSTQQTLEQVRQLENEYNRIQRVHTERRLEYDRLTGPKEIYQSAREEGFINAGPAGQVIYLKP